ncbi:carboxypeptidase regulatory-like domain-containing protein [Allorhodopirellula heiligendammensis]|uniref:Bacterial Ig-like domain (Group 1) n=1 Tax=Allorhodopirellula heiligendammensis TaxID=2714739 RepID=A0A5C6BD68_9BACT|nr:carboxypeptidase regulatory-like domain-containing protein [Allorhodopirellula heiligendammensis]TWU09998.1 hypothetical protein Poly21_53310 [Allorhodopirellula heiligendammensis]
MKTLSISKLFIIGLSATFFVGCSGDELPVGMPSLQPVKVTIVQDGTPLEGASVQLMPEDASNTWASGGSTDATGVVNIMTLGKFEGAPAGTYKVTVDKISSEGPVEVSNDPAGVPPATMFRLVDPQFSSLKTTTAEVTVAEGETTEQLIDVGPAIKKELPKL